MRQGLTRKQQEALDFVVGAGRSVKAGSPTAMAALDKLDELGLVCKVEDGYVASKRLVPEGPMPREDKAAALASLQKLIFTTVKKVAGYYFDEDELHDLTQDVNIRLLTRELDRYNEKRNMKLSTFVYMVSQCVALDAIRAAKRKPTLIPFDMELHGEMPELAASMIEEERQEVLKRALASLSPEDSAFLTEMLDDTFDIEAAAKRAGCRVSSLYVKKCRIVKKLIENVSLNAV